MFKGIKALVRDRIPIGRLSYSQEGEDLVLARILGEMASPARYFVDVGAHHPVRFSNTYYFYRRGWRGINIDPLPGTKGRFERMRPQDVTLECGVGEQTGELEYFMFNEPALNTFSEAEARKKDAPPYRIERKVRIPIRTLSDILGECLPVGQHIDFMTVDVEGFDHQVISSNDWERYRPRVVLVELLDTNLLDIESNPTANLLKQYNYRVISKTFNTAFFVANEAFPLRAKEVRE